MQEEQMNEDQKDTGTSKHRRRGKRWFFVVAGTAAAITTAAVVGNAVASGKGYHGKHHWGHGGGGPAAMMFKQFDADKDGVLTEEELRSGAAARISANDADGSGALSLDEFQGVWLEMMRTPMVRVFQRLDEDGDAQLTQAELNERINWVLAKADRNGDGSISRREIRRGHHHDDHDDDDDS